MDAPIASSMAALHGDRGTAAGPRPMGPMGPVDFLVLFVGLFLVVHIGAGPDDRLDQVPSDRGTGPGSIGELPAGLSPPAAPPGPQTTHPPGKRPSPSATRSPAPSRTPPRG